MDKIKELEERNNRQAEMLDRLFKLIEKQEWGTLKNIVDDMRHCEELLQKEWGDDDD